MAVSLPHEQVETKRSRFVTYCLFSLVFLLGIGASLYTAVRYYGTSTLRPPDNFHQCTIASHTALRILPLGDSITFGWGSTHSASYRMDLLEFLRRDCRQRNVTYIGSKKSGWFENNENEGWFGYSIAQLLEEVKPEISADLQMKPNVVLLHAGTNDCSYYETAPWEEAGKRLGSLVDYVFELAPDTTIIVAQIVFASTEPYTERIPRVNEDIKIEVKKRTDEGKKVFLVDMSMIGVAKEDMADEVHPNDLGYRKMAIKWLGALRKVSDRGWISSLEGS